MSTPGKVLVILIAVGTLAWMLLSAGVAQMNRNGNEAYQKLTDNIAKLEDDLKSTQDQIVKVKDQTTVLQEQMDRELAVVNSRQNDVQRNSSTIRDLLARVQYELTTVQQTVQTAERAPHRAGRGEGGGAEGPCRCSGRGRCPADEGSGVEGRSQGTSRDFQDHAW